MKREGKVEGRERKRRREKGIIEGGRKENKEDMFIEIPVFCYEVRSRTNNTEKKKTKMSGL